MNGKVTQSHVRVEKITQKKKHVNSLYHKLSNTKTNTQTFDYFYVPILTLTH